MSKALNYSRNIRKKAVITPHTSCTPIDTPQNIADSSEMFSYVKSCIVEKKFTCFRRLRPE